MSILVMVAQSWEDRSAQTVREKIFRHVACCSLDEAARLDARSIATLFEL